MADIGYENAQLSLRPAQSLQTCLSPNHKVCQLGAIDLHNQQMTRKAGVRHTDFGGNIVGFAIDVVLAKMAAKSLFS